MTPSEAFPKDQREPVTLRFWQDEGEMHRLAGVIDRFYNAFQERFRLVLGSIDARTCSGEMLDLLAFQRDVDRLHGEPDAMFRLRVYHAAANASDAGSKAGFARIWKRLELGDIVQTERFDPVDWDVILLRIDEAEFARMADNFLDVLIQTYGRTCRRYRVESIASSASGVRAFEITGDYQHVKAVF